MATETICFWRNVHHLDFFAGHVRDLGGGAEEDILFQLERSPSRVAACGERRTSTLVGGEGAVGVQFGVGLGNDVFLFLVGGEVDG